MRVDDLDLREETKKLLKYENLNEPQELAVRAGLLRGKNIVVASPTASGKTLIAEMAMLKNFEKGGKTLYLVPLKALGSEKYADFKEKYGTIMKIALSIGDYDSDSGWLENYDVVITSNEKADSLIRHNASWLKDVKLLIADEIHMIDDISRGPTLEFVITALRPNNIHILALSATISNAKEIAEWLKADLVQSNYRPVKLRKGIYYPYTLHMEDDSIELTGKDPETMLSQHALKKGKQTLVFVSTRKSAEAAAEKIGATISKDINEKDKLELTAVAKKISKVLTPPTQQCIKLAACVKNGTAFHHAGLVAAQRALIEASFRKGLLKTITATPTLAYGVNMPAYRVVVRDTRRFAGSGSEPLSVMEVQQMLGRAGRPSYDKEGEAVLVASTIQEAEKLRDKYIFGEPEPVYSKLSTEPVLRTKLLALISSKLTENESEIEKFFSMTFFMHQYKDVKEVMKRVDKMIALLENLEFIELKRTTKEFVPATNMTATPIGKRVSELYIDPLTAAALIEEIKNESNELTALITICRCIEMRPLLYVKKSDGFVEEALLTQENAPDEWSYEYDEYLAATKTALMLKDWCDECTEQYLNEKYNITPGEIYTKIQSAEWLLFSAAELCRVIENKEKAVFFRKMQLRVKNGVKTELLSLIALKGVGRARARMLYKNNIKNVVDVRKASITTLHKILGSLKLAERLNAQTDDLLNRQMRSAKMKGKYD